MCISNVLNSNQCLLFRYWNQRPRYNFERPNFIALLFREFGVLFVSWRARWKIFNTTQKFSIVFKQDIKMWTINTLFCVKQCNQNFPSYIISERPKYHTTPRFGALFSIFSALLQKSETKKFSHLPDDFTETLFPTQFLRRP